MRWLLLSLLRRITSLGHRLISILFAAAVAAPDVLCDGPRNVKVMETLWQRVKPTKTLPALVSLSIATRFECADELMSRVCEGRSDDRSADDATARRESGLR